MKKISMVLIILLFFAGIAMANSFQVMILNESEKCHLYKIIPDSNTNVSQIEGKITGKKHTSKEHLRTVKFMLKEKIMRAILFILFIGFCGFIITWAIIQWVIEKNKKEDEEARRIFDGLKKSMLESIEETEKIRNKYEPNYDEVKKFYDKYLKVEHERDGKYIWTTKEPMSLEKFLDRYVDLAEHYDCNLYYYLSYMTAKMFSFNPTTGERTLWS